LHESPLHRTVTTYQSRRGPGLLPGPLLARCYFFRTSGVTDFRSSSSVAPLSWSELARSRSIATRTSVFSVILSPAPPRARFSRRRSAVSSSSCSLRARTSFRSIVLYFGSFGVRDFGGGRRSGRRGDAAAGPGSDAAGFSVVRPTGSSAGRSAGGSAGG